MTEAGDVALRPLLTWLVIGLAAYSTPCWSQQPAPGELQQLFQRLLQNPSDIELNFRYAELAIEQDRLRSALAAYERILATDPENAEAKEGIERIRRLLRPEFTDATVIVGGQYETNPLRAGRGVPGGDDVLAVTQGQVIDERRIGGYRLHSEGDLFANFHNRFTDVNYGRVGGNTGPVLGLAEDWEIQPALGAAYAWLDGQSFYGEGSSLLSLISRGTGPIQRINLSFAYDKISENFAHRDAYQIELGPQLYWINQVTDQDIVLLTPFYRFNGVAGSGPPGRGPTSQPFPLESHQFGGRIDYYVTLRADLAFDANFTGYYQPFNEHVFAGTKLRRDRYLSPGAQIILKEFLSKRHDLIFAYQLEDNSSNDDTVTFDNHILSVRSLWRF
jgi:hypothetical protein